jgi:hypothetical protein
VKFARAREINGTVANWYLSVAVFGEECSIPSYSRREMLEAFDVVRRANNLRPVRDDGSRTIYTVCDDRIAEMVLEARGE